MSTSGELLFTFGEANVTSIERDILASSSAWLNDACIAFFFEYFGPRIAPKKDGDEQVSPVLFMNPSAAWMVGMIDSPDELEMCLDQLSLSKRELIVLPVNDSQDPSAVAGGSHWSLLVFHRASNAFFYFDSVISGSSNRFNAQTYAKNLYPTLRVAGNATSCPFKDVKSSSQSNGFDCGLYTVSNAEHACKFIIEQGIDKATDEISISKAVAVISSDSIKSLRNQLLTLVDQMAAEKSK